MVQVELLRHVADNLEAGRTAGHGLIYNGKKLVTVSVKGISFSHPDWYLLAPRTRIINGVEVPAPMDKEPKSCQVYWFEDIASADMASDFRWNGDDIDKRLFHVGIHETHEAAAANCKARYGIE